MIRGERLRRGRSTRSSCNVTLNPFTYRPFPIALSRLGMRSA